MSDYTSYLDRFKSLKAAEEGDWYLRGDLILVERLPEVERKTSAGIITTINDVGMREGFMHKQTNFVRVLYVGDGVIDPETNEHFPVRAEPGDIIMVDQSQVRFFSDFGDMSDVKTEQIGITNEGSIRMRFKGKDAYDRAFKLLSPQTGQDKGSGS